MVNIPYITRCGCRELSTSFSGCTPATFIATATSSSRRWCRTLSRDCARTSAASGSLRHRRRRTKPLRRCAPSDGVDEAIQAGALRNPRLRPVAREFGAVEGTRRDPVLTRGGRACARRRLQRPSHHREYELPYAGRLADVHGVRTGLERALPLPAHRYDCSYGRARCNDQQTSEVMHAHHCAFERPDTDWQVIAASEFSSREA